MEGFWKRLPIIAASAGLAAGLAIGVASLASAATTRFAPAADTDPSTTQPPAATAPAAPADPAPAAPGPGPGPGPGGMRFKGHGGFGPGGGIHGEFVVPGPNGGYQTLATQVGQVTDVSQSSIKVKSEDGFERTYAVDDGTVVTAGRDGIANVKQGDTVHVLAVVTNGNAKAVEIGDRTQVETRRGAWAPQKPASAGGTGGTGGAKGKASSTAGNGTA